jgi:hypothetical protein
LLSLQERLLQEHVFLPQLVYFFLQVSLLELALLRLILAVLSRLLQSLKFLQRFFVFGAQHLILNAQVPHFLALWVVFRLQFVQFLTLVQNLLVFHLQLGACFSLTVRKLVFYFSKLLLQTY